VPCGISLGCAGLACRMGPSHVNVGGRSAAGRLCGVGVVRVCARYAMMLPLNAIGVRAAQASTRAPANAHLQGDAV
jgi:hypothetical protein